MRRFTVIVSLLLLSTAIPATRANQEADRARRRSPVVEVFEAARDAVVNISTTRVIRMRSLGPGSLLDEFFFPGFSRRRDREVHSVGSGIVIHESGYIVTNAHVVAQASDVSVIFADESRVPADVLAVDLRSDLAVLKVDADRELPYLKLGRSDDIMIGETVVAIGNPLGYNHTVTTGIVSALDRELVFDEERRYPGLIQTDAPINPGNSGGPLLNVNAELIGVNTAIRGDAQNIGFAIPVNRLWELLPGMLDLEEKARVKFGLQVAGPEARVLKVRPNSPAEEAGLQVGDRIAAFNGKSIRNGIDYYVHLLGQKPDTDVNLRVTRGDREFVTTVTLESKPIPDGQALAREHLGLTLDPIPDRIRRRFRLPNYIGLIVTDVARRSPAGRARIETGDIILRIDGSTTRSLQQVGLALEDVAPGDTVKIEGLRLHHDPAFAWEVELRANR